MIGLSLPSGFIDLARIDFSCPYCGKVYSDSDDKYLNRLNRNKYGYTKIRCEGSRCDSAYENYLNYCDENQKEESK